MVKTWEDYNDFGEMIRNGDDYSLICVLETIWELKPKLRKTVIKWARAGKMSALMEKRWKYWHGVEYGCRCPHCERLEPQDRPYKIDCPYHV